MVNTDGRSRGCKTCLLRKVRCDGKRPICSQCKGKRQCGGYRDTAGLIFMNQFEAGNTSISSHGTVDKIECLDEIVAANGFSEQPASTQQAEVSSPAILRSPKLDEDNTLTSFFANNFACGNAIDKRSNLFWVPKDFDRLLNDDITMRLSTQAAAAMAIARLYGSSECADKAHDIYGQALRTISKRWQHVGLEFESRARIMSILFLSFFEVLGPYLSDDSEARKAWTTHLKGLGSLFAQCREQFMETPFGAHIFRQARSQALIHALQSRTPVSESFAMLNNVERSSIFTRFDHADLLLIRLADLQAKCTTIQPSDALLAELVAFQADLLSWSNHLPPSWTYTERSYPRQADHWWWDGRWDTYSSGFIAHTWNKMRAAQIILLDLIQATSLQLGAAVIREHGDNLVVGAVLPSPEIRQLVTEICATIPPHYRPHISHSHRPDRTPPLGEAFWLLWVLEVIGKMTEASPELIAWIIQCLERIHHATGLVMARIVAQRLKQGHRGPIVP